jgi:hypothetical protein
VTIGASHVFNGSNDIVPYSAAVNPIDWSSTNNAGYLPTGMNNYGDNPVACLALYRGNLVAFNAAGYQMWQIDPDPQNMALLDAQPVGSIWPRAGQSVSNDLLFLTEVGVRNLGTVGATANMAIGDTGQPIDPLIQAQLIALANGTATYGSSTISADPYFTSVSLLLHMDGTNGSTTFVDSSFNKFPMTTVGVASVDTSAPMFGTGAMNLTTANGSAGLSTPITAGGPLDMGANDFTVEGWFNYGYNSGLDSTLFSTYSTAGYGGMVVFAEHSDVYFMVIIGVTQYACFSPTATLSTGVWHSWAAVRQGTSITAFLDGVAGTPVTIPAGAILTDLTMGVGNQPLAANHFKGEMDEVRVTKGIARYSTNYTPATSAFPGGITSPYDPFSLYYPGRGQYWLFFGAQAFVLTMNGTGTKSWSRYIFPDIITDWTLNAGILYMRTKGNLIWQLDAGTIGVDDASAPMSGPIPFNGVIQWPYLDMGSLGINKMMVGIDIVGSGNCSLQIAFNQNDKSTFNDNAAFTTSTGVTTPYFVQIDDTVPGEPLAFPINAPSYSPILTFAGNATTANVWSWQAANIYYAPTPSNAGGATG